MRVWVFTLLFIGMIPAISSARSWKAGLMIGGGVVSVDDPAGSTEVKTHLTFLNGIATIPYRRDRRFFVHLFHNRFDLDTSNNKVSGEVKSLGLNTSYQTKLRLSRHWKPWVGGGLGFSNDTFKNRILLDNEGFIIREFPNREKEAINLLLNASMILKQMRPFDLGVHFQYEFPISGDIQRFTVAATILY